jgi:O-antigen chain-terminating methyltransferase
MAEQTWAERDSEVAAIFERLREELLAAPPAQDGDDAHRRWVAAREDAERRWWVSAERPYAHGPGLGGRLRGLLVLPLKALTKRLMRWYVQPLAADQREFNAAALRLLDQLHDRVEQELEGLYRSLGELRERTGRLPELDDRVARLERARSAPAPAAPAPSAPAALPDYFGFEARMRGSTEGVRERQRVYVDDFREKAPVLDAGCGRGEFLSLLREAGIEARGVDSDPEMVAFARGEGLDVSEGDVIHELERLEDGSLGGIFAAQLVEHLAPATLLRLLQLGAQKLRPGGLLVAETINPLSLVALGHYFADPTHVQPLVPQTLDLLARQAGFERTELRFLNEPEERLRPVALPPEAAFDAARAALEANVQRLNAVVFGPQDYALLATR